MRAITSTPDVPTTVDLNDHLAAAAYLMKHHAKSALVVVGSDRLCISDQLCIISEADLAAAAARGTDLERTRVSQLVGLRGGCHLASN
jgi:hypothetical protein